MRLFSKKRQHENRIRAQVLARIRAERGNSCQAKLAGCRGAPTDGHEILSRARGGSIIDPTNILLVCRPCHTYITDHPAEAEALGLSKRSTANGLPT